MNPEWIHAVIALVGLVLSAGVTAGVLKAFIVSTKEGQARLEQKIDGVAEVLQEQDEASKQRDQELAEKIGETREAVAEMRGRLEGQFPGRRFTAH